MKRVVREYLSSSPFDYVDLVINDVNTTGSIIIGIYSNRDYKIGEAIYDNYGKLMGGYIGTSGYISSSLDKTLRRVLRHYGYIRT
ncbi:hypothetical protein [Saccharolobus shibatae]|uniref:Uncharacterized protein n=1 Tax=Saccharolobus shibatae TaxID=2286 RepID=A0A8F5BX53_9CREN|nr:hypothetical protein [Saccharolobus shibatae]QXJ32994.1 hypothetical protein J5U21_02654 [Saccharolobus shibatae]